MDGSNPPPLPENEREEEVNASGRVKSAAKWIEDAQRRIKSCRTTDEMTFEIAKIVAARQLAEAERNVRKNIDSVNLYEEQINDRARALLTAPDDVVFRRFLSTMQDGRDYRNDDKMRYRKEAFNDVLSGHGGRLEEKLRLFVHSIKGSEKLNHRLYQRYKPEYYRNYWDCFRKNANPRYAHPDRGDIRTDELRKQHCLKMFTAYEMAYAHGGKNRPFEKDRFYESMQDNAADPMYKMFTMDPQRAAWLNKGDMNAVNNITQNLLKDFSPKEEGRKVRDREAKLSRRAVAEIYKELTGGREDEELENYLDQKGPEFRRMVRAAEYYANKYERPNADDTMQLFTSVIDYQNGMENAKGRADRRDFDASMKLAKAAVEGTCGADKYLKEQIAYVNQKRGIAENVQSPRKISYENIPSAITQQKQTEAEAAQKEAQKKGLKLN